MQFWVALAGISREINVQFDAICSCAKPTLLYKTFGRPPVDSLLTGAGVDLIADLAFVSFRAKTIPSLAF